MNVSNLNPGSSAQSSLQEAKKDAGNAVEHLKDAAVDARHLVSYRAENFINRFEHSIRKDPLKWIGIAFASGYLWRWLRH